MNRREMLAAGFFGVLGTSLLLHTAFRSARPSRAVPTVPGEAAPAARLDGDGYVVRVEGKRTAVLLCTTDGTPVQRFRGFRFRDRVFSGGSAALGRAADGADAIVVDYTADADDGGSVRAAFVPRGRVLEVVVDIVGVEGLTPKDGMLMRENYSPGAVVETAHGPARWERDARGGIPYETGARVVYTQEHEGLTLAIAAARSNTTWRDNRSLHLPPEEVAEGALRATAHVMLGDEARAPIVDALAHGLPLVALLSTEQPYNIWTEGGSALPVRATVYNGKAARDVRLSWIAHDLDGAVIAEGERTVRTPQEGTADVDVTVDLPGRGIAFLELTARADEDEDYRRTNLAVLPPHEFTDDAGASMFGIAAGYLFGPPEERELLRRIGVRRSRHTHFSTAELETYGFVQHRLRTPSSPDAYDDDPEGLAQYVSDELDRAEAAGAEWYELANEWNRLGDGALSGDGAGAYVDTWVRAFRREIRRRDNGMKLVAVGLAGMDGPYAEGLFDAGIERYVDAFNLHPGRGNFTADYAPSGEGWKRGGAAFWNYLGAIREARRLVDERADGELELWLTEVYAPTRPNAWWSDTYRHAAENVLLSAALALTVGVDALLWFQFYDNINANRYGTNARDQEYHYGLVLRDLSPKPSLLAYATAAEHLDGALFRRWLAFDDPDLRGMAFTTPRGPLAILWSRAEGYLLNRDGRDGGFFPSPEPWEDPWQTRATVRLPAAGDEVAEIDVIGRRRAVPVSDGAVEVVLDGAPRLYYGLDTARFESSTDDA